MSELSREIVMGVFQQVSMDEHSRETRVDLLANVFALLQGRHVVLGVLWGGSHHIGCADAYSDCDLFCLVSEDGAAVHDLIEEIASATRASASVHQGRWPWFGDLWSFFPADDHEFSLDIGFVERAAAESFFWEPTGLIAKDLTGDIERGRSRERHRLEAVASEPPDRAEEVLILLKKARKNVLRGHLWNALEYTSQLRRLVMERQRHSLGPRAAYYGRADRNIEDALAHDVLARLAATQPSYNVRDIATAVAALAEWLVEAGSESVMERHRTIRTEIQSLGRWFAGVARD